MVYSRGDGKPLVWVGSSREDVRTFPESVRRTLGHALHLVQEGCAPPDWRPMRNVGHGVMELRVHDASEYRVVYVAKFTEAVYVLHAFEKRTRKTPGVAIELARLRYRQLQRMRAASKE